MLTHQIITPGICEEITITDEIQLKLAEAFFKEGEYYRAITEYKKYLILFPDSKKNDYIWYQIGNAYYHGEDYEKAASAFSAVVKKFPNSSHLIQSHFLEGITYWKQSNYLNAINKFDIVIDFYKTDDFAPLALISKSLVLFEEEKIEDSKEVLKRFALEFPKYEETGRIDATIQLLNDYEGYPVKSELLAGIMSTILPGSGYFYAGHYGDGLSALIINALFIAGTLTAINQENYTTAYLVGGFGLPFYIGNIYGSAKAAKKWNISVRKDLRDEIYMTLKFNY